MICNKTIVSVINAINKRPKTIARNLIEACGDGAEEAAYAIPDGETRDKLLDTIKVVREQVETRNWNSGVLI